MAKHGSSVCEDFVNFRPLRRGVRGTQMSFDGDFIYSYAMKLAYRLRVNERPFFIINGDGAPSSTTNRHQHTLHGALRGEPHAFIPFSQLERVHTRVDAIQVIHTTPAQIKTEDFVNAKGEKRTRTVHYLGETLFKVNRRLYVCGLDRNDDPSKRMFYMCQLPTTHKPKTVDEALEGLRPKIVPKGSPRQGEWFFVPTDLRRKAELKKTPIWFASAQEQRAVVTPSTRHVAAEVCFVENAVYVRGTIRDDEHDTLRLGKVWHRVMKNLATEGWRYVAEKGTRVD